MPPFRPLYFEIGRSAHTAKQLTHRPRASPTRLGLRAWRQELCCLHHRPIQRQSECSDASCLTQNAVGHEKHMLHRTSGPRRSGPGRERPGTDEEGHREVLFSSSPHFDDRENNTVNEAS